MGLINVFSLWVATEINSFIETSKNPNDPELAFPEAKEIGKEKSEDIYAKVKKDFIDNSCLYKSLEAEVLKKLKEGIQISEDLFLDKKDPRYLFSLIQQVLMTKWLAETGYGNKLILKLSLIHI